MSLNTFPSDLKEFDPNCSTHLTFCQSEKPFALVRKYLAREANEFSSAFGIGLVEGDAPSAPTRCQLSGVCELPSKEPQASPARTRLLTGRGLHRFLWRDTTLYMLQQAHGRPVGDGCSAHVYETITLFYPNQSGQHAFLQAFVEHVFALDDVQDESQINVYSFHMKYEYWRKVESRPKRPIPSVFLNGEDQKAVLGLPPSARRGTDSTAFRTSATTCSTGPRARARRL